MNKPDKKYTLGDVGCYVDGNRGIYAIDMIVEIAERHGKVVDDCTAHHAHSETCDYSRFAGCEFAGEIEDSIDVYMNEHFGVEGAVWGRSEQGDWGLWPVEADAHSDALEEMETWAGEED